MVVPRKLRNYFKEKLSILNMGLETDLTNTPAIYQEDNAKLSVS